VKERSLTVSTAEVELRRQEWQNELDQTDRVLEVERKRSVLRRAEIDADVPEGILPKRDYLEKQLALRRARADLEKAEEARDSQKRTAELDLGVRKLALEKVRRELQLAEQMIEALTLRAPTAGTVLIGDHWEGRKLQVADEVPVGHTLVRIPDMGQIRVKAWLSDVDDGRVAADMPAEIVLDAYPDRVLRGKIVEIAPVAREVAERSLRRVFQVSVAIDHPEGADLRPGMSARVEVNRRAAAGRALGATRGPRARCGWRGVRLAADGGRRVVTLGPCNAEACVAMSGVEAGRGHCGGPRREVALPADPLWLRGERGERRRVAAGDARRSGARGGRERHPARHELAPHRTASVGDWDFKIVKLTNEGTEVKVGDPVISFDVSEMDRQLAERTAERDTAAQEIAKKKIDLDLAKREGEMRVAEAEAALRKAELKADLPPQYTAAVEVKLAQIDLDAAKAELAGAQKRRSYQEKLGQAELQFLRERHARAETRVQRLVDIKRQMTVRSPVAGLMVHKASWRGDKKKVGETCWSADECVEVVDTSEMMGKGEVDETESPKVSVGQRALLRLEALPEIEWKATVASLRPTIYRQSPRTPLKVVGMDLALERTDRVRMRPGMSFRGPHRDRAPAEGAARAARGGVRAARRAGRVPADIGGARGGQAQARAAQLARRGGAGGAQGGRPRLAARSGRAAMKRLAIAARWWPAAGARLVAPAAERARRRLRPHRHRGDRPVHPHRLGRGRAQARQDHVVTAPTKARDSLMIAWMLDDGDPVKKGEAVVRFDPGEVTQRLADSKADRSAADSKLEKERTLASSTLHERDRPPASPARRSIATSSSARRPALLPQGRGDRIGDRRRALRPAALPRQGGAQDRGEAGAQQARPRGHRAPQGRRLQPAGPGHPRRARAARAPRRHLRAPALGLPRHAQGGRFAPSPACASPRSARASAWTPRCSSSRPTPAGSPPAAPPAWCSRRSPMWSGRARSSAWTPSPSRASPRCPPSTSPPSYR
jgi:multidrug resistance efflux pump